MNVKELKAILESVDDNLHVVVCDTYEVCFSIDEAKAVAIEPFENAITDALGSVNEQGEQQLFAICCLADGLGR